MLSETTDPQQRFSLDTHRKFASLCNELTDSPAATPWRRWTPSTVSNNGWQGEAVGKRGKESDLRLLDAERTPKVGKHERQSHNPRSAGIAGAICHTGPRRARRRTAVERLRWPWSGRSGDHRRDAAERTQGGFRRRLGRWSGRLVLV